MHVNLKSHKEIVCVNTFIPLRQAQKRSVSLSLPLSLSLLFPYVKLWHHCTRLVFMYIYILVINIYVYVLKYVKLVIGKFLSFLHFHEFSMVSNHL